MEHQQPWKFIETAENYDVNLYKNYTLPKHANGVLIIDAHNAPPMIDVKDQKCVTSWHHMFDDQPNLKEIIFTDAIKTDHVTSTRAMFRKCPNLERIVLPPFAFQNVIDASYMFQNCPKLREIVAPGLFLIKNADGTYSLNEMVKKYSSRIIKDSPVECRYCPASLNLLRRND